jgi:hypothetical protein
MNENLQTLIIIAAIALSAGSTVGLMIKKFWLGTRDRQIKFYAAVNWTWQFSVLLVVLFTVLLLTDTPDRDGPRVGQALQVLLIFIHSSACVVLYPARPRGISKRLKRRS